MRLPLALTAAAITVAAAVNATACARANPEPPPPGPAETSAPQAGSACPDAFDGAMTRAQQILFRCSNGTWEQFHNPYPSSDRWLTTGPELVVHGQGRRNPEVKGGSWTGSPQTAEARCGAELVDVVGAGETSAPETLSAEPGQTLTFDISDHMFTVTLSGYCLWQRG